MRIRYDQLLCSLQRITNGFVARDEPIVRERLPSSGGTIEAAVCDRKACLSVRDQWECAVLATWDGSLLEVPLLSWPDGGWTLRHHCIDLYNRLLGGFTGCLLEGVVSSVHGEGRWASIKSRLSGRSRIEDTDEEIIWHFSDQAVNFCYPFVFDAVDVMIEAPDIPEMFLGARCRAEAVSLMRFMKEFGDLIRIPPHLAERVAKKLLELQLDEASRRERV